MNVRVEVVMDSLGGIDVVVFKIGNYSKPLLIIPMNQWKRLNELAENKFYDLTETIRKVRNENS